MDCVNYSDAALAGNREPIILPFARPAASDEPRGEIFIDGRWCRPAPDQPGTLVDTLEVLKRAAVFGDVERARREVLPWAGGTDE